MSISFKEFMAHPEEKQLHLGDVVNATVIEINSKKGFVVLDGGPRFKSESIVSLTEFREDNRFQNDSVPQDEEASALITSEATKKQIELAIGDSVSVVLEALDNGYGETIFSREKAKRTLAWEALQEALENKMTVQGVITGKVRGGFTVDLGTLKGFLPGSLVDAQHLEEINALTDRVFDFKVITLDYQRNNIVLSQGHISRDALLQKLKEGQVVKGYIKNIVDYGAFINLGGIDGLLRNSDIAWEKTTAREAFKSFDPKQPIEVMILNIDQSQERPRILLGRKQFSQDPWINLEERYSQGMRLEKRRITHIKDYGCFVEIERGVEGLVHISQMDWTNRNPNPHTLIPKLQNEEGRVDVVILGMEVDLEANKRRLSLGIKQCMENPWSAFSERYQKGDHVQGTIRSITDLGLFVHLEGNIDGLVHHSEISADYSGEEAIRQFTKGELVDVIILSIDPLKERIALSMLQLDTANTPVTSEIDLVTEDKLADTKSNEQQPLDPFQPESYFAEEAHGMMEEMVCSESSNCQEDLDAPLKEAVDSAHDGQSVSDKDKATLDREVLANLAD